MNPFKIGFKLEADDRKGTQKICVATIGDVIDSRVLISFDGFDEANNYWTDITSPYIHATNWHQDNGFSITTPPSKLNTLNFMSFSLKIHFKFFHLKFIANFWFLFMISSIHHRLA